MKSGLHNIIDLVKMKFILKGALKNILSFKFYLTNLLTRRKMIQKSKKIHGHALRTLPLQSDLNFPKLFKYLSVEYNFNFPSIYQARKGKKN